MCSLSSLVFPLLPLLQAVTFQVVTAKHRPLAGMRPRIDTLLDDYQCHALPSTLKATLTGHSGSVKVVHFVGDQARLFALNCSP